MSKAGATSKASKKNQTTIPARVRKSLQIAKGDTLLWTVNGDEVSIKVMKKVKVDWNRNSDLSLLDWTPETDKEMDL
ncbi:AbrB/MazE/SpoVT family DNA-binding domain-containing protein [Bdellovibrio reynosensis]|uniref:AbrB/MazE/SpoVT family DNA-binding domain-containing protein n=1 Tax=Bdellovibrio reynosensis TaxID=2835041 RepID=A0ABY4CHS9_9BACT|nr:AbrB/MazE/SpoVT family DNA-binding domain-containing protein [Bdellovibrio reynosensis]UOF01765.1 AbrB/MazE/SpoVT family DNA-binding domain-containing protein [Bdellovibrio reynosensis]